MARAEGKNLALCDKQYILPTNKNPIRGFIQDFIFSGVFITFKDQFFNKSVYCQLLYDSLFKIIEEDPCYNDVEMEKPAIVRPRTMWTGKQLFSNILNFVANYESDVLNKKTSKLSMTINSRVNKSYFEGVLKEEQQVIIRSNQLLQGIIDKNLIGASSFGLIHTFYELFGHVKTKMLVTSITRLCINFLKMRGFTCGLSDLQLQNEAEVQRKEIMERIHEDAIQKQAEYVNCEVKKKDDYF